MLRSLRAVLSRWLPVCFPVWASSQLSAQRGLHPPLRHQGGEPVLPTWPCQKWSEEEVASLPLNPPGSEILLEVPRKPPYWSPCPELCQIPFPASVGLGMPLPDGLGPGFWKHIPAGGMGGPDWSRPIQAALGEWIPSTRQLLMAGGTEWQNGKVKALML